MDERDTVWTGTTGRALTMFGSTMSGCTGKYMGPRGNVQSRRRFSFLKRLEFENYIYSIA